jgi:hypothetical protein
MREMPSSLAAERVEYLSIPITLLTDSVARCQEELC